MKPIHVGLTGDYNWQQHINGKEHRDTKACQKQSAIATKVKATPLMAFFAAKPKVHPDQSDITEGTSATLSAENSLSFLPSANVINVNLISDSTPIDALDSIPSSTPSIIQRLVQLTSTLPNAIDEAGPDDILARFNSNPRLDVVDNEDVYEKLVDGMLNNTIGYQKTPQDLVPIIHRGPWGMDGFCQWIGICVNEMGVSVALLDVQLEKMCKAMVLVYVPSNYSVESKMNIILVVPPESMSLQSHHQILPMQNHLRKQQLNAHTRRNLILV